MVDSDVQRRSTRLQDDEDFVQGVIAVHSLRCNTHQCVQHSVVGGRRSFGARSIGGAMRKRGGPGTIHTSAATPLL